MSPQFADLRMCLVAAALVGVACGQTETTKAPPGKSEAQRLEDWDHAYQSAFCEREMRCKETDPSVYATYEGCLEAGDYALESYHRFFGGSDYYANKAELLVLADDAALDACLRSLEGCGPVEGCDGLLVERSQAQFDEPCGKIYDGFSRSCADGLVCGDHDQCHVGTCAPAPGAGEPCGVGCPFPMVCNDGLCEEPGKEGEACPLVGCMPDLYCDSFLTCRPQLETGEPCDAPDACLHDWCTNSVCESARALGEPCGDRACKADLECGDLTGICAHVPLTGEPCARRAGRACAFTWCIFESASAPEGICGVPQDFGPGPCSLYGVNYSCPIGTRPDVDLSADSFPDSCECVEDVVVDSCR